MTSFQPPGRHTVTPRIVVKHPENLVPFLKEVFRAQGELQSGRPTELEIGDSILMISDGGGLRESMPAFLYVYVDDVDSVYARALAAGAVSTEPPAPMPYGDRRATVRDPWGNIWQIATYLRREGDR